ELVLVADEGKQHADRRTSPSRSKSATGCRSAASSSCCSGSVRAVCDQLNEQVQPAGAAAFLITLPGSRGSGCAESHESSDYKVKSRLSHHNQAKTLMGCRKTRSPATVANHRQVAR